MKTLLALLLLIPSLAWTDEIKYLVCFNWDEKINKAGIKSIGLELNTNTKEYSYYGIQRKSDGDYRVTQRESDEVYKQNADYITVRLDGADNSIDRKSLEWWTGFYHNPRQRQGECELVDSKQSVGKILYRILNDNLDLNKI